MGVLNTPDPQINLGLMVGIWASLGLDFAIYLTFCFILSLSMGIRLFLTFCSSSLGLTKLFNTPGYDDVRHTIL